MLAHEISKAPTANGVWTLNKKIAEETSEKEIRAAEAERASIKYKQIEYMKEQIGKEFTGTISGVTEWGIYIEDDETKSEGMSRLRDLPGNDFYALDAKNYRVIGQKTKKIFSLGDKVKFKVIGADMERRTLDVQIQAK
jgi:ribonuclease R